MDEESLATAIEGYKQQFLQVQTVLQSTGEEGQEELVKLRDDLVELIHVSEESLLSLKKSKLLELLEEQELSGVCGELYIKDQVENTKQETEAETPWGIDDEDDDNDDDIIGTKCRVAFTQEWGVTEEHNAMVFRVENLPKDEETADTAKVRVLFLNPTHRSMVPCPFFLDGKCRFTEEECRYSHGHLIRVNELKPFQEPDFSSVQEGQQCLARYSDGVWYKSTIQSIKKDSHEFVVHYDTYNMDATLPLDDVFPLGSSSQETGSGSVSDDQSSSSDSEEIKLANQDEDVNDVIRYAWKPSGGPLSLGDWEQHTRGIGSKLMAKMGYIFGKGLGRDGSGRVEPIEVVVLPQGKSLDKCAELREKKKLKEPFKRKRKKKGATQVSITTEAKPSDIFEFINNRLGHKKGSISKIRVPLPGTSVDQISVRKERMTRKDDMNTNWNIQLFKIHEEIASVKKQLRKQEDALQRQSGQTSNSSIFREKRDSVLVRLHQLQAKEKLIEQKIHQKDQHKKLTVF